MSFGDRRKPLRRISDKKRAEEAERRVVCEIVRRRDVYCQARDVWPEVRCRWPLDVHERIPRSLWRAGYLEPDNCLLICRAHHDELERNDETLRRAHDLGLYGYSHERPT